MSVKNATPLQQFSQFALQRQGFDNELNNHGKWLLEISSSADLKIMNGRFRGDSLGRPTFHVQY